jgi:hypothetical protein
LGGLGGLGGPARLPPAGHGSYPYRGYYKQIGPGVGERVIRPFDHRRYFADPASAPEYVDDYGTPDRVTLLPDWERLVEPVLADPVVRREWAWFLLPIHYGYPASPSPGAGTVSHADLGNVAPVGPTFNGGWNRIGDASGYARYDVVKLGWAAPMGTADSFFPPAGFLNAPILFFMSKPPLDLVRRTVELPFRAAVGTRQPTFLPAKTPARRLVSVESGVVVTPISGDFLAAFLNRSQLPDLGISVALALAFGGATETENLSLTKRLPIVVAPVYSLFFHLSPRFSAESSLTNYSA